jgi:regulator of replication initiation timing
MRVSSIWRNRANDAWVVSIAFADDSRYHIKATEEVQRLIDEATKELREQIVSLQRSHERLRVAFAEAVESRNYFEAAGERLNMENERLRKALEEIDVEAPWIDDSQVEDALVAALWRVCRIAKAALTDRGDRPER